MAFVLDGQTMLLEIQCWISRSLSVMSDRQRRLISTEDRIDRRLTYLLFFRITLAAMADMAGLDEAEQGVVATVLLASYLVTPTMAFSVSGIITLIVSGIVFLTL